MSTQQSEQAAPAEPFTDDEWPTVDAVLEAIEAGAETPSAIRRKARREELDLGLQWRILGWLVTEQYAHTSGNGNRTHYHYGRSQYSR